MAETPPETGWIEPEPRGRLRLYGILPFAYGNDVRVIVDELDDVKSEIVFAFNGDKDFRDNPVYDLPESVLFSLFYPDGTCEQYRIKLYYPIDSGRRIGAYRLHYYWGCVRGGFVAIDGKEYLLAIIDSDADGVYSDLDDAELCIDLN